MLDSISFRILVELCHDGRASNVKLARELGISPVTVAKKIRTMVNEGVITIKAMPNPAKTGYYAQAFIGLCVNLKKIHGICDQLMDNIHVNMVTTSFGRFDILLIVFFSDFETLQDFIKEYLPQIEGINTIDTYIILEDKRRNRGVFPSDSTKSKPKPIDEVDGKIIEELIRNGRPNSTALANKLGISKATLSRRIALLLKESVIKILAIPDFSKIGYSSNAYILICAEIAKIDDVCDQLFLYPEVHLVMRLASDFDILVGVYSANSDTLFEFLETKVGNIDGIFKTETCIRGNYYYFSADAVFPPSVAYHSGSKNTHD